VVGPESEPAAEPEAPPTPATPPRVVILSDSQAIDRRGRLIDITGLVAVRMIGKTRSWIVPLDSVEGGNEAVLLDLGGDGCDSEGGGGEQMFAGMQILMFEGDTIDCCEGEYEVVVEGECQCPDYLIEDEELGCICENLQDPDDYCFSEEWEYRFEIDAPCTSCVETFYQGQFYAWACPIDCDEPDPPPGSGGPGGPEPSDTTWNLICDTVVRGQVGGCTLEVDPPEALESIDQWTFSSEFVWNQTSAGANPWSDTLVVGGEVIVNFTVGGDSKEEHDWIVVQPRDTLEWNWLSPGSPNKIQYDEGGLQSPPLPWPTNRVAILCHPVQLCPEADSVPKHQLYVQPQDPTHGNGFIRRQVSGGPNLGAWYVESVAIDVRMASAFNPDYFSDGVERPQGCGQVQSLNFFFFNHTNCGTGDPGWGNTWDGFVKAHEQRHADQADSTVVRWPHLNVPRMFEGLVRNSASKLNDVIHDLVFKAGRCVTAGVSEHEAVSGPHPLPGFRIWFWGFLEFEEWKPGDPTTGTPLNWGANPIPLGLNCDSPSS